MEKLTARELKDLEKRAEEHFGKFYPKSAFITNKDGRRALGKLLCKFVGYTAPHFASKEQQPWEKGKPIHLFYMPNAKLVCPKGVAKKESLDKVVAYFESIAEQG